jgi:hypothetical protein
VVGDSLSPNPNLAPSPYHSEPYSQPCSYVTDNKYSSGPAPGDIPDPEPTSEDTDYPRPAPPQDLVNNEEEPPKKDKRQGHGNHDNEKKVREGTYRKMETTRPTRDALGGKSGFGGAGRVLQPSGKGFAA